MATLAKMLGGRRMVPQPLSPGEREATVRAFSNFSEENLRKRMPRDYAGPWTKDAMIGVLRDRDRPYTRMRDGDQ